MTEVVRADEHLADAMWERLACGDLTSFERERALAHVTACKNCTAVHRALLALEDEARAFDPNVPASAAAPAAAIATRWARWVLTVGVAAAAVAVAVLLRPDVAPGGGGPASSTHDVLRAGSTAVSVTLLRPADGAVLDAGGFAWSPVREADAYRVQVNAADGQVIWESPLVTASEVRVPAGVTIPPGTHFWHVTALHAGELLGTSPLSRVSVALGVSPAVGPHAQP